MAIQDAFNLDRAIGSQAYAYKCWYNYNYGNNTMKISASDMGKITQTWSGELSNWRATASDDENAYEIEDDDFSTAYEDGKSTVQDKTGYEGGKGKVVARATVDAVAGAGSAVLSVAGNGLGQSVAQIGATSCNASGSTSASFVVAAPLALATATAYMAKKPNKEQKEACDELQNEMTNSQNALTAAQGDMSSMSDEIISLADEATLYNEDANENIEENKSEYDMYRASYEALMAKVESGETLTEDEKALLEELVPLMQELGVNITETSGETIDVVSELFDEMGTYQEGYDNAAATMAEVQGVTDYAESFDEATRTACYVESAAQGLNAAGGTKAAIEATSVALSGSWAFGATAWAWAFAGMGYAAAGMSGTGTVQQLQWAGDVGTEIDMRRATQDFNTQTTEVYDESIAGYEGSMTTVEDLTLQIPEDTEEVLDGMEVPEEEPEIPEGDGAPTPAAAGLGIAPQNEKDGNGGNGGLSTIPDNKDDKDKDKPVA